MSEGEKLESERREDDEEEDKENLDDSRANSSLTNSTFLASGRIQNEKAEVTSEGVLDLTNLSLTNLERNFHVEYAKVKNLAISGNNLQKFTYMKFFPKCEILDAQDCQINKFIADFNYNLLELYLSRNQLKETNQLGRFENLKILDLSSNLIEGPVVFTLKTLEILNLSSNYLTEIPDLSKCVSLRSLNLAENKIADLTKISNLISPTSLQKLDISSNSIDDLSQFSTFSQFKKLDDVAVAENPCIVEVVESDKFEYRSYIVACCSEALTSIDHEKIQDHIQTEGEWLALQGGIKKIGPGSHVALCEQIASHFPKAENGPPTPAQKSCHKALEKRRSMAVEPSGDSSVRSEDTVNSVYSPFREWNGKIGKNLNLRRTPGSVGKNNLRMCSPPEARKNRSFTFQNSANQLESFIATPSPTQRLQESTRTTSTETVICSARTELSFTVDGRSESTPLPIIETPTKLPERQLTPSVAEVSFASDETEELKNRVRALEQKVTELSKQNETLTAINDALVDTLETFKTEQANMWKAIRSQIPTPQNMTNSLVCETEEGHHVHQVKWDMPLVKGYRIFVDGSSCGEVVGKNQSARITDLTADEPHFVQIQPIGNNGESGEISKKLHIKPPPQ